MKIKNSYIQIILFIALAAVLGLQSLWLYNMYNSYQFSLESKINENLLTAIEKDFIQRKESIGGPISYTLNPIAADSSFSRIKIVTGDTTLFLSFNNNYHYDNQKSDQTALKYVNPLNISQLENIFRKVLIDNNISIKDVAIEFYNQETDETFFSNSIHHNIFYQISKTDMFFIDLTNSIGLKAYVQTPYYSVFKNMLFQLTLSVIMIIAAIYCLLKLSGTIFKQRKEDAIKQNFVNAMTHELKRPITSSVTMLEYVNDGMKENDYSSAEEFISDSIFALKKLNSYVEKIQEISKGEEEKIDFIWENIDLKSFISKMATKYPSNENKEIIFQIDIPENVIFKTDILHFANILENLIENSLKYSDPEIIINIKVIKTQNRLEIIHKDNGWGIADSEINRIFDKFFRSNFAQKRRKNGFGLGLSYVKLMVHNMKGKINVTSIEKEFTEFIIEFPI